jgi:FtsP/CotA-like multicopper oxidase with cupredoxin domain
VNKITRRQFLTSSAMLTLSPLLGGSIRAAAADTIGPRLTAAPASIPLLGSSAPETSVWAYDAKVPGPVFRFRRGEQLDLDFRNGLERPTTVHWHGMRVPNAMDGVPDLTQAPVMPGQRFRYAFELKNPGTFWYHPHFQSAEQLDRGLHGVVIVEDDDPPPVDRDLLWVLDDWRLDGKGQIVEDFGDLHDVSHQGRFGNTASLNGRMPEDFQVRAGERIRLRLVNVANAWIFGLEFVGHAPRVIAYDGHAVEPHEPPGGMVVVGPSQRVDLILDLSGAPGERFEIVDRYYPRQTFKLVDIVYGETRLRARPLTDRIALAPPDLPDPVLESAARHEITFSGGAMGGLRSALFRGQQTGIRELAGAGKVWAVNGVVASRHDEPPVLSLDLGRSYIIDFVNDTVFPHPIHLHGQPFRVLAVNGNLSSRIVWRDTLLLEPRSRGTVALVADNPGRWMLHCHIPEHQEAGMMTVVDVV